MTSSQQHPALWEQYMAKCIHFNGMMNKACDLGIAYDGKADDSTGRRRWPCIDISERGFATTCERAEYLTEEQARAKETESMAHAREVWTKIADNICPTHNISITKEQVGRCVYAKPCGCRLYQGSV